MRADKDGGRARRGGEERGQLKRGDDSEREQCQKKKKKNHVQLPHCVSDGVNDGNKETTPGLIGKGREEGKEWESERVERRKTRKGKHKKESEEGKVNGDMLQICFSY